MNDKELSTVVRESVADVHSASPVAEIISRGRSVRAHGAGAAGAVIVAAGVAFAVAALLAPGHPGVPASHVAVPGHAGSHPATTRLADWTVAKQPNGDIDVTINQLKNPTGLQSTLRADGLPVNVTFTGSGLSASCQPYFGSMDQLSSVAHYNTSDGSPFLVIKPSALPSRTGVGIFDEPGTRTPLPSPAPGTRQHGPATLDIPAPNNFTSGPMAVGLVYTSQQCTG
jgi:hypothetical protein